MKQKLFLSFLISFMLTYTVQAQIELETVHLKTESKTITLPKTTRFYYYPNLEAYFDLKTSKYIFWQNGQWIKADKIKSNYRGYSIYNNYRVEITDYFEDKPYQKINEHRKKFPKDYRGRFLKKQKPKNNSIFQKLNKKN